MSVSENGRETGAMNNPLIGKRVIVRTYSAGVHIGTLVSADGMDAHLVDGYRLWKWDGGALSLSSVADNGVGKGSRLNRTTEVVLTNAIEYLLLSEKAEATFAAYVEN